MGVSVMEDQSDRSAGSQRKESAGGGRRGRGGREGKAAPSGTPFHIYKPSQGTYVRWGTAAGVGVITLAFGNFLYEQLAVFNNLMLRTLLPVGVMAVLALLVFRLLGQNRKVVDFMIATEGEMKKVSWSTRREVLGATRVVIFTVLMLSLLLFIADLVFVIFFSGIGVVRVPVLSNMFHQGGGPG